MNLLCTNQRPDIVPSAVHASSHLISMVPLGGRCHHYCRLAVEETELEQLSNIRTLVRDANGSQTKSVWL